MLKLKDFISIALFFIPSISAQLSNQNCVTIDNCPSLTWIFERRNESHFQNIFERVSCSEQVQNGVKCPIIVSNDGDTDQPAYNGTTGTDFGGATNTLNQRPRCTGSIVMSYWLNNVEMKEKSFARLRYHTMSRFLNPNRVFQMTVQGSCCWKISKLRQYRGASKILTPGYHLIDDVYPQSMKKKFC